MSHAAVLPPVSRQRMSLLPSPLKSWVPGGRDAGSRPILLPYYSVNHSAPSGPAVMHRDALPPVGIANSVITPGGGDPPDLVAVCSVNHSAPSGPAVMPEGRLLAVGIGIFGDARRS